jgi:hypothetical protein
MGQDCYPEQKHDLTHNLPMATEPAKPLLALILEKIKEK